MRTARQRGRDCHDQHAAATSPSVDTAKVLSIPMSRRTTSIFHAVEFMSNMLSTTCFIADARSTAAADHRTKPQDAGMGQQLPTPKAKPQSTKKVNQVQARHRTKGSDEEPTNTNIRNRNEFGFHSGSIRVPFVFHLHMSTLSTRTYAQS